MQNHFFSSGVPPQYIQAGKNAPVALVIQQDGSKFSIQTNTGPQSWTDNFEIGQPALITGPGKKQMEVRQTLSVDIVAQNCLRVFLPDHLRTIHDPS